MKIRHPWGTLQALWLAALLIISAAAALPALSASNMPAQSIPSPARFMPHGPIDCSMGC